MSRMSKDVIELIEKDDENLKIYYDNLLHTLDNFKSSPCVIQTEQNDDCQEELNTNISLDYSVPKYKRKMLFSTLESHSKLSNKKNKFSFYQSFKEYHGVVSKIDYEKEIFSADLVNYMDKEDVFRAEIYFEDVDGLENDLPLIQIGAPFVWILGRENSNGTVRRTSYLRFRRISSWTNSTIKDIQKKAKSKADGLSELIFKSST